MFRIERYHDISCGHRVAGHENKCRHLHGHNYRVTFVCVSESTMSMGPYDGGSKELDDVGRVIDFSVVKERLCMWLENVWDHKFLAWEHDTVMRNITKLCGAACWSSKNDESVHDVLDSSLVWTPFNPTAENMAEYLVNTVGPHVLQGTGVMLLECRVEETRKCSAAFTKDFDI